MLCGALFKDSSRRSASVNVDSSWIMCRFLGKEYMIRDKDKKRKQIRKQALHGKGGLLGGHCLHSSHRPHELDTAEPRPPFEDFS